MNKTNREIPIFVAIDDNYVPFTAVAITSIKEHMNKDLNYAVYVMSEELNEDNKKELVRLQTDNLKINFVDLTEKIKSVKEEMKISLRDYYTISIFYRLFIPSMFPELDKAIYIDSDIVLLTDIAKLYDEDIDGYLLGAVTDQVVAYNDSFCYYTLNALGIKPKEYFNSGVLCMNLSEFRKQSIEEKFIKILTKFNPPTVAPDQDYLNVLCNGKVKYLSDGFNRMPTATKNESSDNYLIHYNMFDKPWKYKGVLYEEYFWYYAKKTDYYDSLVGMQNGYSKENISKDKECGIALIKKALEIANGTNTFKNIINR